VRGYTLRQLRLFTEAAERSRRRDRVDRLVDARAVKYQKREFASYLKALRKDP
jgi:hypothetical protein